MNSVMLSNVILWLARLVGRTVPAGEVDEFVHRLVHDKTFYRGSERRRCPRYPLTVSVSVIPFDEHFRPMGVQFSAVTRNISASGVSFISQTRCEAKYLSLLLVNSATDFLEVVVRVARYRMVGPMYEYAGPFVTVPATLKQNNNRLATELDEIGQRRQRK